MNFVAIVSESAAAQGNEAGWDACWVFLEMRACLWNGWSEVGGNVGIGLMFGWPELVMVARDGGGGCCKVVAMPGSGSMM